MPNPAETIDHTTSRHSSPRAWRQALERAAKHGMLPGFTDSTWAILDVLMTRMNFDTGHAAYVLNDVMERTGLGRATVTKHMAIVRSAGWLAWAEHGSLRNALRRVGRKGYARTATVYAATIPAAYDEAEGNVLTGTGYEARVLRPKSPVDTAGKSAVENSGDGTAWTPSRWLVEEEGQVQVVGGEGTSTANAAVTKTRRKRKLTVTGYKITGERIERARQLAVSVRPFVNWIQGASHDELSWVFLDLVARDWSESRIVLWLGKLGQEIGAHRRRPRAPHRVIAAALRRKDTVDVKQAVPADLEAEEYMRLGAPNAAFQEAREAIRPRQERMVDYPTADVLPELREELFEQRAAAELDPGLVRATAHLLGRDEALRMFGPRAADILEAAVLVTA